ncbi:MAG: hypothetical protein H6R15_496 [Proteobacteria bacterium]|nr:hypothetical protein [Pseudomonadota bacterium]
MHHAQSQISSMGSGGGFLDRPLSAREATNVEQILRVDATNYLYSACVSIGDALHGIDRSLFTWATVKLYYSSFYLLRSLLALSGRVLLYDGTKPRTLICKPGEKPNPLGGTRGTHQAVITYFAKSFPNSPLLSQDIVSEAPFKWLMRQREEANYVAGRFGDPQCPINFLSIVRSGVRRSTAEYISDNTYLYAFDPAHAILALPVETLKQVIAHPNLDITANTEMDAQRLLRSLFADKAGPMRDMLALLRI